MKRIREKKSCVLIEHVVLFVVVVLTRQRRPISCQQNSPTMTAHKIRGRRSWRIVTGHGRWRASHGLLKCQPHSWCSIHKCSTVGKVCWFLVFIIYPCFGFRLVCASCTAAPPPDSDWKHVCGDKQQPLFPAAFKLGAGVTAPPCVCYRPLQQCGCFITYENLKSVTTRVALKTIIFVMD